MADITTHYAYDLCARGKVDAVKDDTGHWLVSEASAMEYARRKRARQQRQQDKQQRKAERRAEQQRRNEDFQTLLSALTDLPRLPAIRCRADPR